MDNLKLWWVYKHTCYVDICNRNIDTGYYYVEEKTYTNATDYALDISKVANVNYRMNKEVVFTKKTLAYRNMAEENNKVNAAIIEACGEKNE